MGSESVIGRHFIQIFSRVIVTLIMHVHLPNCSKHSPHGSSTQRNRLIHLIILLSSALAVYWVETCLKPYEAVIRNNPSEFESCTSLTGFGITLLSPFSHRRLPASCQVMHPSMSICPGAFTDEACCSGFKEASAWHLLWSCMYKGF